MQSHMDLYISQVKPSSLGDFPFFMDIGVVKNSSLMMSWSKTCPCHHKTPCGGQPCNRHIEQQVHHLMEHKEQKWTVNAYWTYREPLQDPKQAYHLLYRDQALSLSQSSFSGSQSTTCSPCHSRIRIRPLRLVKSDGGSRTSSRRSIGFVSRSPSVRSWVRGFKTNRSLPGRKEGAARGRKQNTSFGRGGSTNDRKWMAGLYNLPARCAGRGDPTEYARVLVESEAGRWNGTGWSKKDEPAGWNKNNNS